MLGLRLAVSQLDDALPRAVLAALSALGGAMTHAKREMSRLTPKRQV